ncbi:MAG: C40 family peptidase, partial [Armatimonadota bacterium]|nr:C40 family peptidase [Armatimonadota bacterium]
AHRQHPVGTISSEASVVYVGVPVADLWSSPLPDAGRVSQVLLYTPLVVISPPAAEGFLYVEGPDRYRGWIRSEDTTTGAPPRGEPRLIGQLAAPLFPHAASREACGELFLGTVVPAAAQHGTRRQLLLPGGGVWVEESALRPLPSPGDSPNVTQLLADARLLLGVPYLWGGNTPRGIDCSGFVQLVYRLQGRLLRRDAHLQTRHGRPVSLDALLPGDLLFFGRCRAGLPTHVGIFLDGGEYIHAAGRPLQRVAISPLAEAVAQGRVWGARRPYHGCTPPTR